MPKTESNASAEKKQTQIPKHKQSTQPFEDDTIDLYELWITFWSKKWIVIGVTTLATLGSMVFVKYQPQVYKAEVLLLPPQAEDVQSLNPQRQYGGLQKVQRTTIDIYNEFKNNLSSRDLQKKFIKEQVLMELLAPNRTPETRDEDIYNIFSELFKVGDKSISIELHDPTLAAQWVNNYVKFVDIETINRLAGNLQKTILNRIRDIESTISSKRQMAKQRRQDKILLYEEALSISVQLGMKNMAESFVVQKNGLSIINDYPLYYRGYRALRAEILALMNRESDDAFIPNLRDLQEELAKLNSVIINPKEMKSVTIDRAAYPPRESFKPNKKLLITLGTLVGLFLGLFLVFFVSFVKKLKGTHITNKLS